MIIDRYKAGFKHTRRPLRKGESLPAYVNQADLLLAASKYASETLGEKEYKKYHKNELNKESAKRCAERNKKINF
jgi:hypothetical protein|tara:strand:- start:393 stop:617 length:225 start_codon:yes stop_codon:yes gene_type:complete